MSSLTQLTKDNKKKIIFIFVKDKPTHPPNVNKMSREGQSRERERCSLNGG